MDGIKAGSAEIIDRQIVKEAKFPGEAVEEIDDAKIERETR